MFRLRRNVVNGYDYGKREQRSGEVYTENFDLCLVPMPLPCVGTYL